MKIAHLADIHVRFGSRHTEYRKVFESTINSLLYQKPDRIVIAGDLNHQKINMSPSSIELVTEFLVNLAKIAPVDVILGNHDLNMQQIEQGDTITPIFKMADKFSELFYGEDSKGKKVAHIVGNENIDFTQNGIYYFNNSGFYNINENLTYGVYSLIDNKILTLDKKDPNRKYIALYHGGVYGCRGDNGYEMKSDNLMRLSTFNNFDIVILGDIHEYQTLRDDETAVYCGSLIQQDNGESLDKGYVIWDTENNSHKRVIVPNEYGFSKITISKGEIPEERINNLKFSADKTKTKVNIILQDYSENYSIERENQIKKYVKDKFGCEIVNVSTDFIKKEKFLGENEEIEKNETFIDQLQEYINEGDFDCSEEELEELKELSIQIDNTLEINESKTNKVKWDINSLEISNLFSFPVKPTIFNFVELNGIIGIFGPNGSGKSNVIRTLIWGLYQAILGDGDAKKLVNIYTGSNKAYIKIYLTINDVKYYIYREVKTIVTKKGKIENSYSIEYKMLTKNEDGEEKWVKEISENTATEKTEVKKLIIDAIGTSDDFTKVSLQTQNGNDDYINQKQQPKNDLINRFLGLEHFREREDYAKQFFNDIKKKQKELGEAEDIKKVLKEYCEEKENNTLIFENLKTEKIATESNIEKVNDKIINLTKQIAQIEKLPYDNTDAIKDKILLLRKNIIEEKKQIGEIQNYLNNNFKKEINFDLKRTFNVISLELQDKQKDFQEEKQKYIEIDNWLKSNTKKDEIENANEIQTEIDGIRIIINNLTNQLPTYKGKKCPTCGHISQNPQPDKEKECLENIAYNKKILGEKSDIILNNQKAVAHNKKYDNQNFELNKITLSLIEKKTIIDQLKKELESISEHEAILKNNSEIDSKIECLDAIKQSILNKETEINHLKEIGIKIKNNKDIVEKNKSFEEDIINLKEMSKSYKLTLYNINEQITKVSGDIRIIHNNIKNTQDKLNQIKDSDKLYKKYSLYIQAVHRDGIPSMIIRNKMPLINNKINNILEQIVDFRVNMNVLYNGDIVENFYFSPDMSDSLPLSNASGAQKFIISIAIKDALNFIGGSGNNSSINIIDEGFGTLDEELISSIPNVLQYLKNKYKIVMIVTHRNEIKDCVEKIITISKSTKEISKDILEINPKAGITMVDFPYIPKESVNNI